MISKLSKTLIYFIVLLVSLFCLLPFIMIVTGSISNEQDIAKYGYTLLPKHIDLISYRVLLLDIKSIANSYKISMIVTIVGTFASLLINTMMAYAISRKTLKYRKVLSVYTLVTILFNGGMVPWYIVCVNYLHLKDKLIALIIPYLANAWYIFLLRNFVQTIPDAMHESAKIDGAGEYTIFFKIILRLMTPALATVGLFTALGYWNDWWLGLMLIDKTQLQPLQLLLRTIVSNIMFLKASTNAAAMQALIVTLPSEGIKMAICVITIGPIIFLYPFLQKYFVKGIMIGAVKG
jgi:putative aldouronate transport system permease protein